MEASPCKEAGREPVCPEIACLFLGHSTFVCGDENTLVLSGQVFAIQALLDALQFPQVPTMFQFFAVLYHNFLHTLGCTR
jgi:hypothetical protein